jgi:hypothetical protein
LCAADNDSIFIGSAIGDDDEIIIASDVRWPFNGSVSNESNQPVYPLVSSDVDDRYEILFPGNKTPDEPGRSKDADGVWVLRGDKWFFFPNKVTNESGGLIVKNDGVYDEKDNQIVPWDLQNPDRNRVSSPHDYKNPDWRRGREESRIPPDPNKQYQNAADYVPVQGGQDTDEPKNWIQNTPERIIDIFK